MAITVHRSGAVLTVSDGKTSRTVEYKHIRAAALVADRITTDKVFARQWLQEERKAVPDSPRLKDSAEILKE
ncbi:MAG: hypothetical protein WCO00_01595 [Rhodospirillaceae bacterium]